MGPCFTSLHRLCPEVVRTVSFLLELLTSSSNLELALLSLGVRSFINWSPVSPSFIGGNNGPQKFSVCERFRNSANNLPLKKQCACHQRLIVLCSKSRLTPSSWKGTNVPSWNLQLSAWGALQVPDSDSGAALAQIPDLIIAVLTSFSHRIL